MTATDHTPSGSDRTGSDRAETFVRRHPWIVTVGRAGWAAKGIVYGLMGLLATTIAFQSGGGSGGSSGGGGQRGGGQGGGGQAAEAEASQTGAVAAIADEPAGTLLLVLIAIGLLLYALWRVVTVLLPGDDDAEAWLKRVGYGVSAVVYLTLSWTAVSFARSGGGGGGQSEDARIERITRDVMENGFGRVAVFVVGVALLVIAGYFVYKGATASFESDLTGGGVGPLSHQHLVTMGQAGWVARGLMMALIGFFVSRAAWTFDPDDAKGLDGALRSVSDSTGGTILVLVVAIGLVVYGAFCVLSAPRRRLAGAD